MEVYPSGGLVLDPDLEEGQLGHGDLEVEAVVGPGRVECVVVRHARPAAVRLALGVVGVADDSNLEEKRKIELR